MIEAVSMILSKREVRSFHSMLGGDGMAGTQIKPVNDGKKNH